MAIPDEVDGKLEYNTSWTVQHEDIVQIMDEGNKGKPWSRYMIQRHLDADPAKKTVQDRLDELVELDVLRKYEYRNLTLYDLGYSPIITDGGRLQDASWKELATFRDHNGIHDLSTASLILSFAFFGIGMMVEVFGSPIEITSSANAFINTAIILYISTFLILISLNMRDRVLDLTGFAE